MKIFIDSAKLEEIKEAQSSGILEGVTTNPSLIKKTVEELKARGESVNMEEYIKEILLTAKDVRVSLEVTEFLYDKMVYQGKKLFKMFNPIAKNVYIKIPVNPSFNGESNRELEGLRVIKELSKENIPVNCTLIFTPEQALAAAKAGAKIVSPFAGRIDDYIRRENNIAFEKQDYFPAQGQQKEGKLLEDNGIVSGIDLVQKIVQIFQEKSINSEVLAASIRNAIQVREAALAGADIATVPLIVIKEMMNHYKTQEGMKSFTEDAIPEYAKLIK